MLRTLRIRHLAIIEDLTVEFGGGFNVLTGETGAGKSILIDALGLAVGDRADAALVRTGSERAVVEAAFDLASNSSARLLLEAKGVDSPGEDLVIRREVAAAGSGRVFVGGSPSTVAVLREIGDLIVELHGQHEHQSLLSPEHHLELLDQFGGHLPALLRVEEAHRGWIDACGRSASLAAMVTTRQERGCELERVVREIAAASPVPGEIEALDRDRRVLQNAEKMAQLLEETVALLYEGEATASSLAAAASRRAAELASLDPSLGEVASRVETARLDLQDAGATLREYRDHADFDPSRLESVEARRAILGRLAQKYGPDEESILRVRDEAAAELATIADLDAELAAAAQSLRRSAAEYAQAASVLSRARREAAERLAPAIGAQLRVLALPKARVEADFAPARGPEVEVGPGEKLPFHPRGVERIEFLFSANPGEAPRPLSKVASGGELSRVMLALHIVLEGAGGGRALVFDEVDAGVGGATADAVGARLSQLAHRSQVLCVTHLPQVAAYADRHYHVRKRVVGGRTQTDVVALSARERVDELARMLGGREVTPATRGNAAELLAAASAEPRTKSRRGA